MAEAPFRLGIIGAGGISGAHVGAAKASNGRIVVVGVADPVVKNRNTVAGANSAQAFASGEAMLAAHESGKSPLDGVVVCTPPFARLKIINAALRCKVPVLSEKPLAHTLAEAKKIASLSARHRKVPFFVAYCHRFAPAINEMNRMVAQGKIGRLVRFENFFACDLPGHQGKWFSDLRKSGGGAFLDMGSHSVDLFHYMVGPSKVVASAFDYKWKGRAETAGTVMLSGTRKGAKATGGYVPAGVAGMIVSGWAETSRFTLSLVGDGGMLSYDYEKPNELIFKDLVGKAESITVESHDVRFARQLQAFADAARGAKGDVVRALASGGDGLAAAMINDAAAKAAKKR